MKRPEEILGDQILRLVDYALSKVIKLDITLDKVTDLNADELEKINFVIEKNYINFYLNFKNNRSQNVLYSCNNIISSDIEINLSMMNNIIKLYK